MTIERRAAVSAQPKEAEPEPAAVAAPEESDGEA